MEFNKDMLYPFLLYSLPVPYNKQVTLYPVMMRDILSFQVYSQAITLRKNSRFSDKKIIKMPYLDFLIYAAENPEIGENYDIPELKNYFFYALHLLHMICKDQKIQYNQSTFEIRINECNITPEIFDDLRRIIILQNGIDFDIDEFINYDTEKRLLKAQADMVKGKEKSTIEDYIDSLCVAMHLDEKTVMEMPVRKFWRFIERFKLYQNYTIMKTGECSGMVSFKEPIPYWMISIDETEDKYAHLKTEERALKDKLG